MKKTPSQIATDLRILRKLNKCIEIYEEAQARYEKKLQALSIDSAEYIEVYKNTTRLRNAICDFIVRATAIEKTYIVAIEQLEPLNETIVIAKFLNCNSNLRIAELLNYSLESINKRLPIIYTKLSIIINKTKSS